MSSPMHGRVDGQVDGQTETLIHELRGDTSFRKERDHTKFLGLLWGSGSEVTTQRGCSKLSRRYM